MTCSERTVFRSEMASSRNVLSRRAAIVVLRSNLAE
jgi:hypothetical protein